MVSGVIVSQSSSALSLPLLMPIIVYCILVWIWRSWVKENGPSTVG